MSPTQDFKYFVKIQKAYGQDGDIFVEGVASGTIIDYDCERMTPQVLQSFVDAIPLPLTDAHPKNGPILAQLGEVIEARILNDGSSSLFIKARLEKDHPAVPVLVKRLNEGKRFAFSVEGYLAPDGFRDVFDSEMNSFVREYTKIIPKSISVTSEPSYLPSFMEVVAKASKKTQKDVNMSTANNLINTPMKTDDNVKSVEESNGTSPETESNTTSDEVIQSAEITNDEVVEKAQQPVTPSESTPTDPVSNTDEKIDKIMTMMGSIADSFSKFLESQNKEESQEMVEESKKPIIPEPEMGMEENMNEEQNPEFKKKLTKKSVDSEKTLDKVVVKTEKETITKSYFDQGIKGVVEAVEKLNNVATSLHNDVEQLKDMPLKKKSIATLSEKTMQQREFGVSSDPFVSQYKRDLGID